MLEFARSSIMSPRKILTNIGLNKYASFFNSDVCAEEGGWTFLYFYTILGIRRYSLITVYNFPPIPRRRSFGNRYSLGILSKALLKSTKQKYNLVLLCMICNRSIVPQRFLWSVFFDRHWASCYDPNRWSVCSSLRCWILFLLELPVCMNPPRCRLTYRYNCAT